ncbi:DUF4132 domain-containing protein [Tenacibaculum sp. nBUS_03]|uniref:DUF4132 domain-containing protein n=1 Tax=Tenacibaculum sp. nBUS_03 TaxID=3395320 RepID=UPI003EBCEF67
MLKKLKSLFKLKTIDNVQNKEFYDIVLAIVAEIQTQSDSSFFLTTGVKFSNLDSYSQFKKKDTLYKKHFALWLLQDIIRIYNKNSKSHNLKDEREVFSVQQELLSLLFRSNLELTIPEYIDCLIFFKNNKLLYGGISSWPIGFLLLQLERKVKKEGLSEELELFLNEMLTWESIKRRNNYCGADISKVRNRIKAIISFSNKKICQRFTFNSEEFGDYANQVLENHNEKEKETLYQILALSKKVSGSKPTKKFSKESSLLIDKLDFTDYKTFIYSLLERVIKLQPKEEIHTYGNQEYSFSTYTFIEKENLNILKGLVWTLTKFYDKNTVILISKLAEKCFKKIPGVGQTAGALGNACLYTLANIKGRDGIAQLTVLQNKIKQTSTKKLIEKYISEISLKLGISKSDIEESIVSEFNLIDGSKEVFFEDYKLKISIERIGKVQKLWIKPDGKIQKTEPSFIKNSKSLSEKFKKIKLEIKEIQKFVSSQRDRLDGLFIEERTVNYTNFSKFYLNHGLISFLSKKLIWIVKNENKQEACFYLKDKWVNACQKEINWIDEGCSFQLWHPIYGTTNEVLEWRNFLVKFQITQPLKQAFRELYLLTEAEVNTKTYSNRMASHILKQHQFNMLAKVRNWNYQLVGAWIMV